MYHSKYGAMQESTLVFIESGLRHFIKNNPISGFEGIRIFEMGLGTGLNALLSWNEALALKQKILYHAIELYPLTEDEIQNLNYEKFILNKNVQLPAIHHAPWSKLVEPDAYFSFCKTKEDIREFTTPGKFHIIYFDAFDPNTQPELWTEAIFKKMYAMLYPSGILVTYCSKGSVRRAMKAAGFAIEKLKGPPGKREITRATKPTLH